MEEAAAERPGKKTLGALGTGAEKRFDFFKWAVFGVVCWKIGWLGLIFIDFCQANLYLKSHLGVVLE